MDDGDFSDWELPPWDEADFPSEPPPPLWPGLLVWQDLIGVRPGLAGLADLATTDFAALGEVERIDALLVLEQHRAWLDGVQQQLLAAVAAADRSKDRWAREEVAAALGIAAVTAGSKLNNAAQLCSRLPRTLALLLDGRITAVQARIITEASYPLPEDVLATFEERVLRRAPEQTVRQLSDVIARAVLRLDPASAEHRKTRAVADRHVRIADAGDGMAWLSALLPAEQAHACRHRLDAATRLLPTDDDRTLDLNRHGFDAASF